MQKFQLTLDALGTKWWITAFRGDQDVRIDALDRLVPLPFEDTLNGKILETIQTFESDYSRFRNDSYIGRLNAVHVVENAPQELIDMITFANTMFVDSGGIFDIGVGGALQKLGYGRADTRTREVVDKPLSERIQLQGTTIKTADITLDFGGFGKGWLIDKVARIILGHGFDGLIINGGGDMYIQCTRPIMLPISSPTLKNVAVGYIEIRRGGFAVSSPSLRQWKHGQKEAHHLIDPRTNLSARTVSLCATVAESALVADVLATVFLLCDDNQRRLLAARYNTAWMLLDGTTYRRSKNFPMV